MRRKNHFWNPQLQRKRTFALSLAVIMALSMILMSSASVCCFAGETAAEQGLSEAETIIVSEAEEIQGELLEDSVLEETDLDAEQPEENNTENSESESADTATIEGEDTADELQPSPESEVSGESNGSAAAAAAGEALTDEADVELMLMDGGATGSELGFDYSWYYADGELVEDGSSAADPYIISTKDQLKALAQLVNGTYTADDIAETEAAPKDFAGKYLQLENDIAVDADGKYTETDEVTYGTASYNIITTQYTVNADAEIWTPIGTGTSSSANTVTTANYFAGTFDGNGHTISGIYTSSTEKIQGLFGCVSGTVRSLTVSGCITANSIAGGIAAYINGAVIENCTNNAVVFADGGTTANGGSENGLSRAGAVGGITGRADGTSSDPFTLSGNENNGTVICANSNKGGRAGGVAGLIETNHYGSLYGCVNRGAVEAYQYAGGIAGMIASAYADIDYCGNIGRIEAASPGSTYVGGITAQTKSNISYCFNTGNVHVRKEATSNTKVAHAGGIVSDFVGIGKTIRNCYNTGLVTYNGYGLNTTCTSWGTIVGTGYGSTTACTVYDCLTTTDLLLEDYPLTRAEDYNFMVDNNMSDGRISLVSEGALGLDENLAILNGSGRGFVADTGNINGGNPVLRTMINDTSTVTGFELTSSPSALSYVAGQAFDTAGMTVTANWSDGTTDVVPQSEYAISIQGELQVSDTSVTVSGTYGGASFSYTYPIEVAENHVVSVSIAAQPTYKLYAQGEIFNTEGMTVRALYTNGQTLNLAYADGIEVTDGYTYEVNYTTGLVTVSYAYNGDTVTCTTQLTILSSPAPQPDAGGYYLLGSADDMIWFSYAVSVGNLTYKAKLTSDIDLLGSGFTPIGTSGKKYGGEFDGAGHTVTISLTGSYCGLFGYAAEANIHDVTTAGQVTGTGNYIGGLLAYGIDTVITNCSNSVTVTSTRNYAGGIAGYLEGCTVSTCTNTAGITAAQYVGGIAGNVKASSGDTLSFSDCINKGTVTANTTSSSGYAGGIIGNGTDASGAVSIIVSGCGNTGDVSAVSGTTGKQYVGGIVGYFKNAYTSMTWSDMYNTGVITGSNYFGGIAGYMYNSVTCTLENTYNTGTITSTNDSYTYVGAIVGRFYRAAGSASNAYYLEGSYTQAKGSSSAGTVTAAVKTHAEMTAPEFASLLGDAFMPSEEYPVFLYQTSGGYTVTVSNSDTDGIIVTGIPEAADGTIEFTVASDAPCIAVVDAGGTVTALTAEATAAEGVYGFTADINAETEISIWYKGDADCSGAVTAADINSILWNLKGGFALSQVENLTADVTGDGNLNILDADQILKYISGSEPISW